MSEFATILSEDSQSVKKFHLLGRDIDGDEGVEQIPISIQLKQMEDNIMKKLVSMENRFMMRQPGSTEEKKEEKTVKQWLENVVRLPQYYDMFINHGFDDLEIVGDMTIDNLKQIGVNKLGHQIKIIKYAKKLP